MTLGEWLDIWLKECAEPSVRPSTYKGYRGYAERNIKPSLGNKQISKVTAADVQTLYRKLQREGGVDGGALSPTTVRRIHGVLHQALNAAVDRHLIVKNPTDDVTLPKKVTAAKLSSMTNSWNDSWKLLRQMSTGTTSSIWRSPPACGGVSCAALCGQTLMRKRNADRPQNTPQQGGRRLLCGRNENRCGTQDHQTTAQHGAAAVRAKKDIHLPVDISEPDPPGRPHHAEQRLHPHEKLLAEAGLPDMRFHDLRHTFATHALTSGVDAKTLSGILGHTKTSFTLDTYTHVTGDMHRKASGIVGEFMSDFVVKG